MIFFRTDSFLGCLKTDKDKSEMKESAKLPTIKFHQPEDFTAPGPCPIGNRRQEKSERESYEEETDGKRKRIYDGSWSPFNPNIC